MILCSWQWIFTSKHRRLISAGFAMLAWSFAPPALSQQAANLVVQQPVELRVGVQQLDYYPHYDFSAGNKRGYFAELMRLFGRSTGYQIRFVPLPVKRLYQELADGLDLVYPDNPAWPNMPEPDKKVFSDPVVFSLGSTLVLPAHAHFSLHEVRSVALIHGYTPTKWLAASQQFRFEMVDVADTGAALRLVLKGRVDATPVELNVAQAWLAQQQQAGALVVAPQLPFTQLPFLLSTIQRPELIAQFNQFQLKHAAEIAALKKRFALQENRPEVLQANR